MGKGIRLIDEKNIYTESSHFNLFMHKGQFQVNLSRQSHALCVWRLKSSSETEQILTQRHARRKCDRAQNDKSWHLVYTCTHFPFPAIILTKLQLLSFSNLFFAITFLSSFLA